jgi:hypothetical protein
MIPVRAVFDEMRNLIAFDPTYFDPATTQNNVHLAKAPFIPSLDLDISTLVEATFPGYSPNRQMAGAPSVYYDALTGLSTILLKPELGDWLFNCTGIPTPAETIYGYYLTDSTNSVLIASALLGRTETISAAGQGINLDPITLKFLTTSPF